MTRFFKKFYFYLILLFLYAPILTLVVFSFNGAKSRGKWGGFSLRWYQELFRNAEIMDALGTTLLLAILAALISTVIGTISALALHKSNVHFRKSMINLTYLPMILDETDDIEKLVLSLKIDCAQGSPFMSAIKR